MEAKSLFTIKRESVMEDLSKKIGNTIRKDFNIITNNNDVIQLNITRLAREMYSFIIEKYKKLNLSVLDINESDIDEAFEKLKSNIETEMCNILETK